MKEDLIKKYLGESIINAAIFNIIQKSPFFEKLYNMSKKELIKKLGYKLYIQRGKQGRLVDLEREIFKRKYNKQEMVYLLYDIEYSDGKIPD